MFCVSIRRSIVVLVALYFSIVFAGSSATAGNVTLELIGGDLKIIGQLVEADDSSFIIEAELLGRVTVSRKKFRCTGIGCPVGNTGSHSAADPPSEIVRVLGSPAIGVSLFPQLIRDYANKMGAKLEQFDTKDNSVRFTLSRPDGAPPLGINLKIAGTSSGLIALAENEADISMAGRPISDGEIGSLAKAGLVGFSFSENQYEVGVDGIAVILSPDNPVSTLSLEDISRIFSGEISNWSEFGAPAGRIEIYSPESERDSYQVFGNLVLRPYKRRFQKAMKSFNTDHALASAVGDNAYAIGFVSTSSIKPAVAVNIKDTCGLLHKASDFTVLSGEYPLSRKLYFYTGGLAEDTRSDIVRFAMSPDGDRAVEKAGFVSKSIRMRPFDFFRTRISSSIGGAVGDLDIVQLRQLMSDLEQGYRLSTTLRFQTSSTNLKHESAKALNRVIAFMKQQDLSARRVLLAGYSDSSGRMEHNLALSLRRAEAAREVILKAARGALRPEQIVAKGYGELFPITCNDTETGRERNRRVEIWLVPSGAVSPSVLTKQL